MQTAAAAGSNAEETKIEQEKQIKVVPSFKSLKATYPDSIRKDASKFILGTAYVCEYLHVPDSVYAEVYEPSEDTFLLIDALHVDIETVAQLIGTTKQANIIEVG